MSYGSSDWQSWVLNEEESLPLLKHAFDVGINTWDTASHPAFLAETNAATQWLMSFAVTGGRLL